MAEGVLCVRCGTLHPYASTLRRNPPLPRILGIYQAPAALSRMVCGAATFFAQLVGCVEVRAHVLVLT